MYIHKIRCVLLLDIVRVTHFRLHNLKKSRDILTNPTGESSRSGYGRGRQHLQAIRDHRRKQNNAFAKHIREEHEGRAAEFRVDIIKYHRTPLEQQIREGVEITRAKADCVLSSKLDYFQPGMRRMTFGDIYEEFGS